MKMENSKQTEMKIMTRNIDSLDCTKGVACIFVILIHCTFPGMFGEVLRAIARFAVPLFFAVTGYFLLDSNGNVTKARILRKLKHIVRITILADIFYMIFRFGCFCILGGDTIQEVFVDHLTLEKVVRFVLTNSPLFYSHLWFLYALIYSYGILYVIEPKAISQKLKCIYVIMALGIFTLCSEVLPVFGFPRSFTSFHIGIHNFFCLGLFHL